ncbi:MAG TPA: ABC transporter ATP-binding protein [Pseudorhodoferax sp.]|nr:ABC transporter ATP-binding protein [Pseudorhodoferax sp.]
MHSPSLLLQLRGLSVRYGSGSRALSAVDLDLAPGEIVAILGPNGAGKTTVLRAVSGLLQFHRGQVEAGAVLFDGRPLQGLDAMARVRAGIAQVMEGRRIFGEMSVAENLMAGAYTRARRGAEGRALHETLARVLDYFPILQDRLHGAAGYLSGGEQQMLAIGRALMAGPRLLLLDEPSLGVAPKVVAQISGILQRINASGVSVLLVEQNASVALDICHRAVVLENGQVAMHGTADALRSDPRMREIYLGMAGEGRRSVRAAGAAA